MCCGTPLHNRSDMLSNRLRICLVFDVGAASHALRPTTPTARNADAQTAPEESEKLEGGLWELKILNRNMVDETS